MLTEKDLLTIDDECGYWSARKQQRVMFLGPKAIARAKHVLIDGLSFAEAGRRERVSGTTIARSVYRALRGARKLGIRAGKWDEPSITYRRKTRPPKGIVEQSGFNAGDLVKFDGTRTIFKVDSETEANLHLLILETGVMFTVRKHPENINTLVLVSSL